MSRKNQKYTPKAFESTGNSSDTSANIYMSMLTSAAFKDLSPRAKLLYVYCKAQYYGQKTHPVPDDPTTFVMQQSLWSGPLYELYSENNKNAFYRDMTELIYHGFIRCLYNGKIARKPSTYQFSNKWQVWGTENFKLSPEEKTLAMLEKERKEAQTHSGAPAPKFRK